MEAKEITIVILKKNGFKKFAGGMYVLPIENSEIFVAMYPMKEMPNARDKWLATIINGYTNAKIAITYVHELQQALTLCGVDKKIEV